MKLRILLNLVSNEFVRDNRGNKESQAKETFNEILDSSYVEESQEGLIFTSFLSPYSIKLEEKHLEEEVVIANPILFQRQVNGAWDITDTLGSDNFIKHLAREANNSVVEGKAEQAVLVIKEDSFESLETDSRKALEHLIVVEIEKEE